MYKSTIPVVFATNEKYAPFVSSCVESIKANSSKDYFYKIVVFNVDLAEDTQKRLADESCDNVSVECLDVSEYIENIKDKLYSHSYFSQEMYYRILIPDIFPNDEKVIYLDCDMIVLGDLSELYNIDIGSNAIAACRNLMHEKMRNYVQNTLLLDPNKYVNSGMLVINCQKFIDENIKDRIFEEINHHDILTYPDQDLINLVCKDSIFYLPLNWNYLWHLERLNRSSVKELLLNQEDLVEFKETSKDIKILHYTGDKKPWSYNAIEGADIFWEYAKACTFADIIYKSFFSMHRDLQKIKLLFIEFENQSVKLTCSYNVLNPENTDSYLISINNDLYVPTVSYKRQIRERDVLLSQRIFSFKIPLKKISSGKVSVCFIVNRRCYAFQYDKFFPLNGCEASYFAHNGVMMYRDGKSIVLEKCTLKKRIKKELAYLKQLLKSKDPYQKSSVSKRLAYFLTKPFISSRVWLISDRPSVAGDNGEALFSFLSSNKEYKKQIKPYFVIDAKSSDFKRLKKKGRVLKLSSFKHKLLSMHCVTKAVSQTNYELYNVIHTNYLKDILYKEKRVFLQHGITKDDISQSYSKYYHNFDLFVTAAYPEYESIIDNKNYGCDASVTKLTGFPRHDILRNEATKAIVITPTWRKELFYNNKRNEDAFKESEYFNAWHGLLTSERLIKLLRESNYEIWFVPHNNIECYLDLFSDLSDDIKILSGNKSYADIFSKGAILISDYSSNTFEFSYLRKPVIYYQFDAERFFASHTYKKGYFDYSQNGFGPVVTSEDELINEIEALISIKSEILPVYRDRIDSFFAFNDQNNSRRVVEEILKIRK